MSEIVEASLSREEARSLTDEIKLDAERLWAKLLEAYEGGAHLALGYSSWGDYFEVEFGQNRSRGYQLVQAARVIESIPESTNVDRPNEAQARELASLLDDEREVVEAWREAKAAADERSFPHGGTA